MMVTSGIFYRFAFGYESSCFLILFIFILHDCTVVYVGQGNGGYCSVASCWALQQRYIQYKVLKHHNISFVLIHLKLSYLIMILKKENPQAPL